MVINSFYEKSLVTLKEISERYSIPLSTLRRWASERKFPLYKVSNRIRVSPEEFQQWINASKVNLSKSGGDLHETA